MKYQIDNQILGISEMSDKETARAILESFVAESTTNKPGDGGNVADALKGLCDATYSIANAITPLGVAGDYDTTGTYVRSLTEAVAGLTASMCSIACAIESLADAVRDK